MGGGGVVGRVVEGWRGNQTSEDFANIRLDFSLFLFLLFIKRIVEEGETSLLYLPTLLLQLPGFFLLYFAFT